MNCSTLSEMHLDEVDELPLPLPVKVLRVVQA